MSNRIKTTQHQCPYCKGTGLVEITEEEGHGYRQCPVCMATFSFGDIHVRVEGDYSDQVKDVTSHIFDKLQDVREKDKEILQKKQLKRELTNDKLKRLLVVGGFWLGFFLSIGYFLIQVASKDMQWYKFTIVIFLLPLFFTILGAFVLKTTSSLKEENFMKLVALTLKLNFSGLKSLTDVRNENKAAELKSKV